MTLVIKENSYNIRQFNLSIGAFDEDGIVKHHVNINFDDDNNFEEIGAQIATNFDGDFTINNGNKNYNFSGYKFEDISFNIDLEDRERISLRLSKAIA